MLNQRETKCVAPAGGVDIANIGLRRELLDLALLEREYRRARVAFELAADELHAADKRLRRAYARERP